MRRHFVNYSTESSTPVDVASLLPVRMPSAHSLFTRSILSVYIFSWKTSWTQWAEVRSTRSTFAASDWMKGSLAQLAIRPRIAICSASKSPADHVGCCSGGKAITRRCRGNVTDLTSISGFFYSTTALGGVDATTIGFDIYFESLCSCLAWEAFSFVKQRVD